MRLTSSHLRSWIKRRLLRQLEHLLSDVSELAPTSHIVVFANALKLRNKFFRQPQLVFCWSLVPNPIVAVNL